MGILTKKKQPKQHVAVRGIIFGEYILNPSQ